MKNLSTSSKRNCHTYDRLRKTFEDGKISSDEYELHVNIYKKLDEDINYKELSPEFKEYNLEYDLRTTDWILHKVRTSENYAQNIYAALCNNDFYKVMFEDTPENILEILKGKPKLWHCSWRYAGGIVSNMREQGDYMDWYCSGIRDPEDDSGYVSEGVITSEVQGDFAILGWKSVE